MRNGNTSSSALFRVLLPADQKILVTTSEKLECELKASFGIVIGAAGDGQESRVEKATATCPATRSLDDKDRIELVPFFRDWAANHCTTAVLNTVGKTQYVSLFEDSEYRDQVQREIEAAARSTLEPLGMLLVQCSVIIEPREPKGVFATPEILDRWQKYKESIYDFDLKKIKGDFAQDEATKRLEASHANDTQKLSEQQKRGQAELEQETVFKLRELALELKRKEAALAILEQAEAERKDKEIGAILDEMASRTQERQLTGIRREEELKKERELQAAELAELKRQQERVQIEHQQQMLVQEKIITEKQVELLVLKQQINAAEVESEQQKGKASADNVERQVLAQGAHETRMREMLLQALPIIVEHAAKPIEKMGEIRVLNLSGAQSSDGAVQGNLGSMIASASTLPIIREVLHFLQELDGTPAQTATESLPREKRVAVSK